MKKPLRIAVIAPPWLHVPSDGYGGVEAVLDSLVEGLIAVGAEVEVFGVGRRKLHGAKVHPVTQEEQFQHILKPMFDFALPIPTAHVLKSLEMIREDGHFDIIHDHNYFTGPTALAWATRLPDMPPAVHTIHGPPVSSDQSVADGGVDNRPFWRSVAGDHRLHFVSISDAMQVTMPSQLKKNMLPTVHNAVDVGEFPFVGKSGKKRYFMTLARFSEEKGQHIAAKLCGRLGYRLQMAGTVATIDSQRKLVLELANPLSHYRHDRDFEYYSNKILKYTLRYPRVRYVGGVSGKRKLKLVSEAKALLFPITWNEPFGMAVIEALACGTPVIAMNRGAMPEIIEHGVNGFLANDEKEFAEYMQRIDEIEPEACRRSVEEKFSAERMALAYIDRYREAIARDKEKQPKRLKKK